VALQFRDDPRGDQFFALRTFRRDGSPVPTPVWLACAGDRWYGYTPSRSGKARRIRQNARVEVAPSDFHGEPRGDWRAGRARIMPASELRTAKRAMTAKYGNRFRLFVTATLLGRPRRHGGHAVGLELTFENDAPVRTAGPGNSG
jgi:hypothetical protein